MTKSRKKTKRPVDVNPSPTTAAPIAVSGAYLRLAQGGKLERFSQLQATFWKLRAELQSIEQELTNCNDPVWLAKFVTSVRRTGQKFETAFTLRVAQLEHRKSAMAAKLESIRQTIEKIGESIPIGMGTSTALMTPAQLAMSSPAPRGSGSGPNANAAVQVRDQKIRQHRMLPNRQICLKLDAELMQSGGSPLGFPESWKEDFGAHSFTSAYNDPKARNRVQKLIWKAKQAV